MPLSLDKTNGIYQHVLDVVVKGLESKEIEAYEATEIAEYVLDNVEKLQSEAEIAGFYKELAELWPFLDVLSEEQSFENQEKIESEATEGALALLQHGKVEEAIAVAKAATNS